MTLDLPVDDAIGVWYDLERALAGKNGYGGDVAEIYAYRLVPQRLRDKTDPAFITGATQAEEQAAKAEAARVAGANMTCILRHFAELHEGAVFAIEEREGFRPLDLSAEFPSFPSFDWRVQLRVVQTRPGAAAHSIHELRKTLSATVQHVEDLTTMLDELARHRAKDRLRAEPREPAVMDDLPPDGATGLYLDRAFNAEDLEWIKMAWDALLRGGTTASRPGQLMLVFQAIRRDERSTTEFLRVMNTVVLPLLRRIRLKVQPHLTKLGTISE